VLFGGHLFNEIAVSTHLSRYFRQRRQALGLRFGDLARRMGYKSLPGVCNKLVRFEEQGDISLELFNKLAAVLEIDEATIRQLAAQDRREQLEQWTHWANQPIEPKVILRIMPAVYWSHRIPQHLTTIEEMEAFAQTLTKEKHMKGCLIVSRRLAVYFDERGEKYFVQEAAPGEHVGPYMRLRGRGKKFIFGGPHGITPITTPELHGPQPPDQEGGAQ
jgi:transcriptional regulator with XRE-family HTH domain